MEEEIRTELMAVYASLNPRDTAKAAAELFNTMSTQLTQLISNSPSRHPAAAICTLSLKRPHAT